MFEPRRTTCPLQSEEHAALLLDYCARRLDSARSASLEAHMDQCPSCREFRDGQRLVWASLDAWEHSGDSWGFDRRLRERLQDEGVPAWLDHVRDWRQGISWKPAIPLAAALALWLAVFPPARSVQDGPAPPDEQIERVLEDAEMLRQLPLGSR